MRRRAIRRVATVGAVDEAFNLHSRPGAPNVVYLDFTGHTVTGTAWNGLAGTDPLVARPFDLDGSPSTFGATELAAIAEIWARVAEDYAPFNIDVTTEEPTSFDRHTGRVLITNSTDANGKAMPYNSAGGVAYIGVWGSVELRELLLPGVRLLQQPRATAPPTSPRPVPTSSATTSASPTTAPPAGWSTTRGWAAATSPGRPSWATATTTTSPSGARASTPGPTTPRTTSPSSPAI